MNEHKHNLYVNSDVFELQKSHPSFFNQLLETQFIVEAEKDELSEALQSKESMLHDSKLYNVVINTTLDCNLQCWYCYETRIPDSRLSNDVINMITRHITYAYQQKRFKTLKISFFGGEPFMDFNGIHEIMEFSKTFCMVHDIELIADFTTNATLITESIIEYLKQFRCHFQITLDGGKKRHNQIKKCRIGNIDTYQKVIDVLNLINHNISEKWVAVRINFDHHTLKNIDEILSDISFLDRKDCYIILKKVWQLEATNVDNDALKEAIQKCFNKKFLVDYYFMPKESVCFAERENQVLFNYDGKIFKCTTISEFNNDNKLGQCDSQTGEIRWEESKMRDWYTDIQPEYCKMCHWFPACLGICNRQILAHKGEKICTFDASSLTQKEYLMYLFKYSQLKHELFDIK